MHSLKKSLKSSASGWNLLRNPQDLLSGLRRSRQDKLRERATAFSRHGSLGVIFSPKQNGNIKSVTDGNKQLQGRKTSWTGWGVALSPLGILSTDHGVWWISSLSYRGQSNSYYAARPLNGSPHNSTSG